MRVTVVFRVDRNYDQAYFPIRKLDAILSEMLAYYESIPALSIAMSQGGDFLGDNGGHASWVKRKAMNSFICSVDRPFSFMGRINEDVNTYTNLGRCGELFMTIGAVQLGQKLGIDVRDISPAERASMDGVVAGDTTYREWFLRQPYTRQKQIVGETRAKLIRDGGMSPDEFYTDKGEWLTLKQLRERDAQVFRKAGI